MADWPQVVGAPGGAISIPYIYSSRNDGAPTAGQFSWFRGGTWPHFIYAVPSYVDANGVDWTDSFGPTIAQGPVTVYPFNGNMRVFRTKDPTVFVEQAFPGLDDNSGSGSYIVAGPIDDVYIESPGPDPFTDGDELTVCFTFSGAPGAPGGGTALNHTWQGFVATQADPTTGKIKGVSATDLTAVTAFVVSQTDTDGFDVTAVLDSLDDSTNTVKGQLRIFEQSDPTRWAIYDVTGVTDHAGSPGYAEIAVTYIAGSTTNLNFAGAVITFSPAGDKGAAGPSLVPQASSGGPVGSAPTVIQTGTSYAVEDEFEIVTNDEIEIAAGACLAIH